MVRVDNPDTLYCPNCNSYLKEIENMFIDEGAVKEVVVYGEKESVFMFNKEVVVRCESGLHNKQATYFVQKANEFESSIWLESGSRKMNAKSLLGIMSLGIVTGAAVTLSADGADAEDAVNALETMLQRDVY